ncbi:MAG: 2-oxoacid:ferredoxin oxidoreductase subunit beta, partial [Thermosphaera sp.]
MALAPMIHPLDRHLRTDRIPTLYCPGCGLGIGLGALLRGLQKRIDEGLISPDSVLWVGGIGCSARLTFYVNYDSAHVLHGRA